MKTTALFLVAAICLQIFCLPMQQSLGQTNSDLVPGDIPDSDVYFRATVQRPRLQDYSIQIEALLRKMTIEEKVGQMTQLEIGQVTSGGDSNINIDPAKLEKAVVQYK